MGVDGNILNKKSKFLLIIVWKWVYTYFYILFQVVTHIFSGLKV